jgi:hypothetical protein
MVSAIHHEDVAKKVNHGVSCAVLECHPYQRLQVVSTSISYVRKFPRDSNAVIVAGSCVDSGATIQGEPSVAFFGYLSLYCSAFLLFDSPHLHKDYTTIMISYLE